MLKAQSDIALSAESPMNMTKEDEELLNRVAKEAAKEGLEFEESGDPDVFHEVIKRLIDTPPAPKQKKRRRIRTTTSSPSQ